MKTQLRILIALAGMAGLLAVFALSPIAQEDTPVRADSRDRNLPTPTPYPASLPGFSARLLQKYSRTDIITTTVRGVEMSAGNFRIENDELKVDICFQSPSPGEWTDVGAIAQLGDVILLSYKGITFDTTITLPNGQRRTTTFLGNPPQLVSKDAPAGLPDYRCDTRFFRLDKGTPVPSQITLTISFIVFSPSEGEQCTKTRASVQSILDSKNAGIRIDCVLQEFGTMTSIAEKPSAMSREEAERLAAEAFDEAFKITGPWIFVGTIEP